MRAGLSEQLHKFDIYKKFPQKCVHVLVTVMCYAYLQLANARNWARYQGVNVQENRQCIVRTMNTVGSFLRVVSNGQP